MPSRKPRVSREKTVVAQAPCRADLAGSTLDIWPLYLFHPGAVTVNFAVNVLAIAAYRQLRAKPFNCAHLIPAGKSASQILTSSAAQASSSMLWERALFNS